MLSFDVSKDFALIACKASLKVGFLSVLLLIFQEFITKFLFKMRWFFLLLEVQD